MADETTVAERALQPGEQTSEHAVMESSGAFAKVMMYVGMLMAFLPQAADLLHMLPVGLQDSKYVQITLAALGGLTMVIGAVKKTAAEVAYINSRGLVKAAAVRDTSPEVSLTVKPSDIPPGT